MKEGKNDEEKEEKPFNVILLGNIESEKEALIHKLIKKRFAINQLTKINQNISNKNTNQNVSDIMNSVDIHGETVKMKIYDNTSASKIFSYSNKNLSSAQGIILFYSVCNRNSYNILKSNLHKIMSMNKYDFPMVMVGNDSDSPNRQVSYEEAKSLADSYGLSFYEVSINSGLGIKPIFEDLGEQVVYRKYGMGDEFGKNNKSINKNENNNLGEKFVSKKSKNKNITIYTNIDLYENEFNKNIKEKMLKNRLTSNSYIINANTSSHKRNRLKTNYKTFTNESRSDLENSLNSSTNHKKMNKSKETFIFKSPDLTSSSVVLSYRGKTEAQKKREEEIRQKRLLREKEMKTWWKQREKENLEFQRLKKEKEKQEMKERIKLDKRIQKEKEKKFIEENLMKVKLNYEQKKLNNKQMEQEILTKRENMRKEKLQEKKINKERLNKMKEEKETEEKEKEKLLLSYKSIQNAKNKNQGSASKNTQTNSLNNDNNKKEKSRLKSEKNKIFNSNLSQNNSCILKEEKNDTSISTHNYENKEELIESYKNNSNIYRCLKCRLIPDILINESNQEIEIICDHSYEDYLHHNITTYSNFIEQSLNHPIDNNNIFCAFCQKYANEFPDDKNIFFCQKCDDYFCSDDEEKHRNLMHKIEENIKNKYLNISKNKIKEKATNKKNTKLMMTPMRNKLNKTMTKQNTTPNLSKKTNNKIIPKKSNNDDNAKTSENFHTTENNKNSKELPFYLIDSYCGIHKEVFKFYCFNCHQNFCELCSNYHINHSFIKFDDILLSNDELNSKKKELNKAKEDLIKLNEYFSALIEAIKCKFERLFNIKKKELEIKEKIILDYETIKYNYHCINNIRNINFENNDKFLELNPNADWFTRFNLIFKNLNTNLSQKENDIFDKLKTTSLNEKNNTGIISKNYDTNKINKLVLLKNEDIAALTENKNIIIFDKDNFEEKLYINLDKEKNLYINDIIPRTEGGIIITGYEFIKFINLGLDNQYYNLEIEIKDVGTNINSLIEFNNNVFISLNDFSTLKLWKKIGKDKYVCIDCYNCNNEEISQMIKINTNSFILSSNKENCLYKLIINKNDKIELISKLENIDFIQGNKYKSYNYNNIINFPNEKYFIVSCNKYLLLIDKNKFNIIQKFSHNYKFINLFNYSENYFIAIDSKNILYKIEFNKYLQKLFFEDNINLNNNYLESNNDVNNIIICENIEKIILEMKDKFIKISNSEC